MDGWLEVDDRRWIMGDRWQSISFSIRRYWDYAKLYPSRDHFGLKLRSYNRAQIRRHTVFQWHGSTEYEPKHFSEHYSEHYSEILNHAPTCLSSNAVYDPESDPELQQQCRYRTSRTRLIFGGATIFKEGDDSAGFATTLPLNNYRTGSTGTTHRETHSPIEKASNGEKCTRRSDAKHTYRWIKKRFRTRQKMILNIPNCLTNVLARDNHRMPSWDSRDNYQKDDYQIALDGRRRNVVLSGAQPTEGTDWDVYQTAYR